MIKNRFRKITYCSRCDKELFTNFCPDCGGTFLQHVVSPFAVLEEKFVKTKFNLFKPRTWSGGYWEKVDVKLR